MIHAQLHDRVDAFLRRDAFHQAVDRFVDHRHQHAVADEAGIVVGFHRRLVERARAFHDRLGRGIRGLLAADDLDELHQRHRIHEVHADHAIGALGDGGDLSDRDRTGVRSQDRARRALGVELREDLLLEVGALADGLDHEIDIEDVFELGARAQARARRGLMFGRDHALFGQLGQRLLDRGDAFGQTFGADVDQQHLRFTSRKDLRDAVAHRACADDGDLLECANAHISKPPQPSSRRCRHRDTSSPCPCACRAVAWRAAA